MENQKIQQLIRLASIADKNGDYKIADKIFNKLAASPPKPIMRMRRFEDLMKFIQSLGSNLAELESRIKHLENLKTIYDNPRFQFYKGMTSADLLSDFNRFNKLKKDLPALKKKHELEKAKNSISLESIQATDAYYKADNSIQVLEPFYGQFKFAPVALNDIDDELDAIQKELAKIKPQDLESLPSNDPQRILIEKLKRQFGKIQAEQDLAARGTLEPIRTQETGKITKVKQTPGLFKRNTTTTESLTTTKSKLDPFAMFRNVRKIARPLFEGQLDKFLTQKKLREGLEEVDMSKVIKGAANPMDAIGPLSAKLPDLIKLYDFKFFQAYGKAVEQLTNARNLEITNSKNSQKTSPTPVTVPNKFDPAKNLKDFEAAAKIAAQDVRENTQEGRLIGVLFDTIQSTLNVEVDKAIAFFANKNIPSPSTDQILREISKKNPNFVKSTGLDQDSLIALIEKRNNLTLEDFLELKIGKVSGISSEYFVLAKFLLGIGAVTMVPIAFVNYQAQKAKKALEDTSAATGRAVRKTTEDITGETARKEEQQRLDRERPSVESIQDRIDRIRKQRGR